MKVSLQEIQQARQRLQGVVHETQTGLSSSASQLIGSEVFFKYENLQLTGSFKIRGAFNKISSLTEAEKKRGVVASSAGNHAQGVALSAKLLGLRSTIVMPAGASHNKIAATRSYGAEVVLHGAFYDEAYAKAREIEKETGAVFVHPYEDADVVRGQGTVALEILERVPDLDSLVVPVGGGGLISGIATAVKALRPECRVIGVQSEAAPSMAELFKGRSHEGAGGPQTIADGIAVKNPSKEIFEGFIRPLVDEMVTVSDDEIAAAIVFLLERTKNLVEGSGAASLAAMMNRPLGLGKKTCAVLSGGNIDLNVIAKVVAKGLIRQGRLVEFSVIANDQPGTLELLTRVLASQKANIMEIRHDRTGKDLSLREAKIDVVIETAGPEHSAAIMDLLKTSGFRLRT